MQTQLRLFVAVFFITTMVGAVSVAVGQQPASQTPADDVVRVNAELVQTANNLVSDANGRTATLAAAEILANQDALNALAEAILRPGASEAAEKSREAVWIGVKPQRSTRGTK